MSAWLVSNHHLNLLATFAHEQGIMDGPVSFSILRDENVRSLLHRYGDEAQERAEIAKQYRCEPIPWRDYSPSVILKQVNCYNYQACEHPDYEESEAFCLVEQLREELYKLGAENNGPVYDRAPWGV